MDGAFGKILLVNLTEKTFSEENVAEDVYRQILGGKGLGTWLLLRHNPPGISNSQGGIRCGQPARKS